MNYRRKSLMPSRTVESLTAATGPESMDDRALMAIRANVLYTYGACGRMLQTNEPREQARSTAPRLFLGSTAAGRVVRFGASVSDGLVRQLAHAIDRLPAGELRPQKDALDELRGALQRDAPVTSEAGGPAYRFPESLATPGAAVRLTDGNNELIRETFPWLSAELGDWQPCFAVVRDGAAVSVCFSARMGDLAAEAGVSTLPEFRGHGYAAIVSAAWALAIRESGRMPLYSTAWENTASQRVAARLGLIRFGADATWE